MDLFQYLFVLFFLSHSCTAGPLIAQAARAAKNIEGGVAGSEAAQKILNSRLAARFGVGVNGDGYGWIDRAVIIDNKLYYGPPIVGGGALAAGVAGGVAGGVVDKDHTSIPSGYSRVTDKSMSNSIISSVISQLSAYSVSGSMNYDSMRSSLAVQTAAMTHRTELDPFSFVGGSVVTRSLPPNTLPPLAKTESMTTLPPPPATPYSTVPPSAMETAGKVPPGVPEYNRRMFQYDLIRMGQNNVNLVFDAPNPSSIRVDNIPSTCMTLANYIGGDPAHGPHPVVMGASSLQWSGMTPDDMDVIRLALGSAPISSAAPSPASTPPPPPPPPPASKSGQ